MKIAIVGTSNSVMSQGWAAQLRQLATPELTFDNFSLGANPSLYGNFPINRNRIAEEYDMAFLDFSINDQQMIDIKAMSPAYLAASYGAMLRHFALPKGRCTPVALLIPQRDHVANRKKDAAYNITLGLCRRYGVQVIDLFEAMRNLIEDEEVDVKPLFADWGHLANMAQGAAARAALRAIRLVPPRSLPDKRVLDEAPHCFVVPEKNVEYENAERSTLGTSFVSHEVASLAPDTGGRVKDTPWLCGMVHWIDKDSGPLCFEGAKGQRVKKALRKEWGRSFALTWLKEPMAASPNGISFRFADLEDYPLERGYGMTPQTEVAGSRADIVGFIGSDEDMLEKGKALIARLGNIEAPLARGRESGFGLERLLLASLVKFRPPSAPAAVAVTDAAVAPRPAGMHSTSIVLANGARQSVPLPGSSGIMMVMADASMLRAMIGYRVVGVAQLHNIGTAAPNVIVSPSPLPKTAGQRGYLTLGLNKDHLEIENLRGGQVALSIIFFG